MNKRTVGLLDIRSPTLFSSPHVSCDVLYIFHIGSRPTCSLLFLGRQSLSVVFIFPNNSHRRRKERRGRKGNAGLYCISLFTSFLVVPRIRRTIILLRCKRRIQSVYQSLFSFFLSFLLSCQIVIENRFTWDSLKRLAVFVSQVDCTITRLLFITVIIQTKLHGLRFKLKL